MLEGYYPTSVGEAKQQRLLAVQAALEIAKASVSSATAISGIKSGYDLDHVINKIDALADAIQNAINK